MAHGSGGLSRHFVKSYLGNRSCAYFNSSEEGMVAIHELMHAAWDRGFPDDVDFADAAGVLAGEEHPKFATPQDASRWWDDHLSQACGFASATTHKFTNYKLYK